MLLSLELPKGSKIKSIVPHGMSYWTRTARIVTEQEDGSKLSFLLKVSIFYELKHEFVAHHLHVSLHIR